MKPHLFFLGHNEPLSRAEIEAIIPGVKLEPVFDHCLKLETEFDLESVGCRLGGTTKIAEFIESVEVSELESRLAKLIATKTNKNFSILLLGKTNNESYDLAGSVKRILTKDGVKARFVAGNSDGLSPLVIKKQSVLEYIVIGADIYQTVWVHPFKDWIVRDRKKPFITPKSGMLPPKLARIMVNLAIADKDPKEITLLDPFCGTGTVLMEASIIGAKVVGSDLSGEKVQGTHKNLDWLPRENACGEYQEPRLLVADATSVSKFLKETKIDVIATEPTLGPPSPKEKNLANLAKGLQKLYLGMLKDWRDFLAPGARVVVAFPLFHGQKHDYQTSSFIDARENLGYNIIRKDLIFTRPGAQIERQIIILERI